MRLLTETPTHHPKNPVNSENSNHPTQGTRCNPGRTARGQAVNRVPAGGKMSNAVPAMCCLLAWPRHAAGTTSCRLPAASHAHARTADDGWGCHGWLARLAPGCSRSKR
jgi:hypothetical protein